MNNSHHYRIKYIWPGNKLNWTYYINENAVSLVTYKETAGTFPTNFCIKLLIRKRGGQPGGAWLDQRAPLIVIIPLITSNQKLHRYHCYILGTTTIIYKPGIKCVGGICILHRRLGRRLQHNQRRIATKFDNRRARQRWAFNYFWSQEDSFVQS